MIDGIDIGSANTKNSEGRIFESVIYDGLNIMEKGIRVNIDNKFYTVGDSEGSRDLDVNKAKRGNNLILLYTMLGLSTTDVENQVVLGLPIGQYMKEKDSYKDFIMENNYMELSINNLPKRPIRITDCIIYPEGIASVTNNYNGIILDIGGKTVDICAVENGKIMNPLSLNNGTLNLYSKIINQINSKFTLDLGLNDIKRILSRGLSISGVPQNIDFVAEIYNNYIDEIITKINLEYSLKTNDLLVLGGGGKAFFEIIKAKVKQAMIIEDPIFSNAKGFKKVGEAKWL